MGSGLYIYIYIDIRQNNRIETLGATEISELLITPLSLRRNKSTDGWLDGWIDDVVVVVTLTHTHPYNAVRGHNCQHRLLKPWSSGRWPQEERKRKQMIIHTKYAVKATDTQRGGPANINNFTRPAISQLFRNITAQNEQQYWVCSSARSACTDVGVFEIRVGFAEIDIITRKTETISRTSPITNISSI